jgi:hypothetical protein
LATEDAIGFIRPHGRIGEKVQRSALNADGCRAIVLEDRDAIERMTRTGTVLKVRNIFLFADPAARRKAGGWRKDLLSFMARICKRGGIIKDVETQLTTAKPDHKLTLIDLAMRQLSSNGRTVHLERQRSGRRAMVFSADVLNRCEKVWINTKRYPTEHEAAVAMKAIDKDFSAARARRLWGPRKYSQNR